VAGARDSVRWRTGLSSAPFDSRLHQTASLVVGAINTPTTPPFITSKFSTFQHITRAIAFNSRHNQRDQILSQVRNHSKSIVTRESDICVHLSSCAWIASFLCHSSCDSLNCNRGKRHQLCGGPCGDLVSRVIEKRSSLGLSDRLREGKG
jgi:hypothetical protein